MLEEVLSAAGNFISDYCLLPLLIGVSLWFTVRFGAVQITMLGQMLRQLVSRGSGKGISSFQAFAVSIASRVGTGNLAGVATAIMLGGPGAVFWMWVMALVGASSAFVESTLAQLYKRSDNKGGYIGGPAYYILYGLKIRWWAILFAILISGTFGLAYNSVQSNTIAEAFATSWSVPLWLTASVISVMTLIIIWGGLKSIARFSQWVVPVMALAYVAIAVIVIGMNLERVPQVLKLIFENAFGIDQAVGGGIGAAMSMGIRRGLFSNEAGEGSAPNVAATSDVSHPVKQGLVQALGVFTDTLLVCTATAFIILLGGLYSSGGYNGISLTQYSLDAAFPMLPGAGTWMVGLAIFFFAFTSIVANYYYGETNIRFITPRRGWVIAYRLAVTGFVFAGGLVSLNTVWALADISMSLMAICNLCAIVPLGRYALICLRDYRTQLRSGKDPHYRSATIPEISSDTPCW